LPIWWIISQILANFYLNDFDQFLKHKLKLKSIRYMDDVVLLWIKEQLIDAKLKISSFVKEEKLILNPHKISFNLVEDWLIFVWYKIYSGNIYAWKRIKKSFLKMTDTIDCMLNKNIYITNEDKKRIDSVYYSRVWCFKITTFWKKYIEKRGNTDFIRGANANNGANTGLFTVNLNWSSGNTNRNVGFRCSQ
jgi:hypothetical protein